VGIWLVVARGRRVVVAANSCRLPRDASNNDLLSKKTQQQETRKNNVDKKGNSHSAQERVESPESSRMTAILGGRHNERTTTNLLLPRKQRGVQMHAGDKMSSTRQGRSFF
jgi:hypothetical protein